MSEQIRVLLVDDQDLIRTGFRLLLMGEPDISVVGEAKDGQAALDELARLEGHAMLCLWTCVCPG